MTRVIYLADIIAWLDFLLIRLTLLYCGLYFVRKKQPSTAGCKNYCTKAKLIHIASRNSLYIL